MNLQFRVVEKGDRRVLVDDQGNELPENRLNLFRIIFILAGGCNFDYKAIDLGLLQHLAYYPGIPIPN